MRTLTIRRTAREDGAGLAGRSKAAQVGGLDGVGNGTPYGCRSRPKQGAGVRRGEPRPRPDRAWWEERITAQRVRVGEPIDEAGPSHEPRRPDTGKDPTEILERELNSGVGAGLGQSARWGPVA